MCPIVDWGLLEVRGPDAEKFLQGQVTCDVRQLREKSYLSGAFCNPKGRVLATFRLISMGDIIYLRMPRDLIPHIQTVLQKYAAFFQVELEYNQQITGLFLQSGRLTETPFSFPNHVAVGEENSAEIWGTAEQLEKIRVKYQDELPMAKPDWWKLKLIKDRQAQIFSSTSEQFLAHQLSLDLSGAISFRKGCYTGQEIIARTQYRGKSKKRLANLLIEGQQKIEPGTEIFSTENKPIGNVLLALYDAERTILQSVMPDEGSTSGDIILGTEKVVFEALPGSVNEMT